MTDPIPYPDPPLGDGRVRLRRWRMDDLACIEEASAEGTIPEGTTVPAVYTEAEGRAFIERQWGRADNGEGLSLAIADAADDVARGLIVLMLRRMGAVEMGYWIVRSARGQGRAPAAVGLLSRWAVGPGGYPRVWALVEPGNDASVRVLEKAGFRYEGLLRSHLEFATRRADALSYSFLTSDGCSRSVRPLR